VRKLKEEADAAASQKIICPITKREFKSISALNHFKNSKEYKRQLERFEKKQKEGMVDENGEIIKKKFISKHHIEYRAPDASEDEVTADDLLLLERDAAAEKEEAVVEEEEEAMEDGENALQEGQKAIPLKYSLFDPVGPFKTVRSCLNYMLKHYGFYLPFVDYLIDVEGLLEYLGAKIGIGHQCLLCNKRFETTLGCQQHMVTQGHCMFTMSNASEEEEQELLEYYDFSHNLIESDDEEEEEGEEEERAPRMTKEDKILLRQQQRLRSLQLIGARKATEDDKLEEEDRFKGVLTVPVERSRHVVDMNEAGEIMLSDGAVIGARKHKHNYKVAVSNAHRDSDTVNLRRQLISQYYALSMPGYDVKSAQQKAQEKGNKEYQKYFMKHQIRSGSNMNLILRKHFVPQVPM